MFKSILGLTVVLFLGFSSLVMATDIQDPDEPVSITELNQEEGNLDNTRHSQWRFLGCVHNQNPEHECSHLAHGYGYYQHTARHDHFTCYDHDHSFACYGR